MTTDDCIKELRSSMSGYPITELRIYDYGVIAIKYQEKGYAEFDSGIEMLEWIEENLNRKGEN